MTLTESLPGARQLPAQDELRLIRILAEDLDVGEDVSPLEPNKLYYLATPYDSFRAGRALMNALKLADGPSD